MGQSILTGIFSFPFLFFFFNSKMRYVPNEIILCFLLNLNNTKDIISFTSTCSEFLLLRKDELFWRDLIHRKYQIKYCDPSQTWWDLLISGDASSACHHLTQQHTRNLATKRPLLWYQFISNQHLCLDPNCQSFMYCQQPHPIALKLSRLYFMEVWCDTCNRSIGSTIRCEKYISRQIIQSITQASFNSIPFIQSKRQIEQELFYFRDHIEYQFMIKKSWFMTWIEFLTGIRYKFNLCRRFLTIFTFLSL